MFNRAGWLCVCVCVCHENSIPLANKKTGVVPRWSLSKLFADALFSLFRCSSGWKSGCRFLVACPPLLTAVQPGVALRTLDLQVTFSGSSSPSVPSTACSLAQPPCRRHRRRPRPIRKGFNRHHCAQPVMLRLSRPVTRPPRSAGNLHSITPHNRFVLSFVCT